MKIKELNNSSNNLDAEFGEVLKKKERHIVSWSQEVVFLFLKFYIQLVLFQHAFDLIEWLVCSQEDDILREQIHLHGSEK